MIDRTRSRLAPGVAALGAVGLLLACGCAERREPFEIELPEASPVDPETPDSASPDSASPDSAYIGLTLEEARELAEDRGLDHRVTRVDGQARPVTTDFRLDRINFHVEAGRIIAVSRG